MKSRVRDILEFTIAIITEFASNFNLTERQAYRYINFHKGLDFIEENYGIMHTLDFNEAVESVAIFCRKRGGEL